MNNNNNNKNNGNNKFGGFLSTFNGVKITYYAANDARNVYELNRSIIGRYYSLIELDIDAFIEDGRKVMKEGTKSIFGTLPKALSEEEFFDTAKSIVEKSLLFKYQISAEEIDEDDLLDLQEMVKEEESESEQPTLDELVLTQETKEGIMECLDFAKNAEAFRAIGARCPKGILLNGKPGTGKTSIAVAIAKETGAEFFYASGSEFIEKYVGVGAARVRELFDKARKADKAIIFIDEIDAIGGKRESENAKEDNKTLNQLLTEMDGFRKDTDILVIGATNRKDLLDSALLRPGRFDRHYNVDLPTEDMRVDIINLYLGKVKHEDIKESTIRDLAKETEGFSGADLSNLINESAIYAVRCHDTKVSEMHIYHALGLKKERNKNTGRKIGFSHNTDTVTESI